MARLSSIHSSLRRFDSMRKLIHSFVQGAALLLHYMIISFLCYKIIMVMFNMFQVSTYLMQNDAMWYVATIHF